MRCRDGSPDGIRSSGSFASGWRENLQALDDALAPQHEIARLACEGGWYATLRTPPFATGEALAVRLLEKHGVAVHPGSFFGFAEQNRLVVSLLPRAEVFAEGVAALLAEVARES